MKHSCKPFIYLALTLVSGLVLGAIFSLYLRPDFLLELGNRFFMC